MSSQTLGFCDRASWANCEVRKKTNKMQQLDVYYQHFLNMFRASLCPSSGEQDVCYCTWCAALVLLDVVGNGCGALRCGVRAVWRLLFDFTLLAPYNAAPHNPYQPHPAEPTQHTTCSNTRFVLLKMGIMMPETCWESIDNKHLTVASCWFSLSLHNLLTMHGHRNLKFHLFLTIHLFHITECISWTIKRFLKIFNLRFQQWMWNIIFSISLLQNTVR